MTPNILKYNSERENLIIPEYGRNIQLMIQHLLTIEDRERRSKAAHFIVSVMAQMNPQVKESNDYIQKLWDHMHIIANYQLDVDSPYEKPVPEEQKKKPEHIGYTKKNIKYGHYGQFLIEIINKASEYQEGEERTAYAIAVANQMKRDYLNWNRDTVNDSVIAEDLKVLSKGLLIVPENVRLIAASEALNKPVENNSKRKRQIVKKSNFQQQHQPQRKQKR